MIFFIVVVGTAEAVARVSPRFRDSLEATRIVDGELIDRVASSGRWAAAAIAEPDPICASRFICDQETVVVVNGAAFSSDGDQAGLRSKVLDAYRSGGSHAVANEVRGNFNFVGVTPKFGLRGFGDPSGTFPLDWYQGPD